MYFNIDRKVIEIIKIITVFMVALCAIPSIERTDIIP